LLDLIHDLNHWFTSFYLKQSTLVVMWLSLAVFNRFLRNALVVIIFVLQQIQEQYIF